MMSYTGLCNAGVTARSVKIRSDGWRRKWWRQAVISEFGDRHDGAWPKNGILTLNGHFNSFLLISKCCMWVLYTNKWLVKWWKEKGKGKAKSSRLDQDLDPGLNFLQQKSIWRWVYTVITVDGPLDRLDGRHLHFWNIVILTFWRYGPSTVP